MVRINIYVEKRRKLPSDPVPFVVTIPTKPFDIQWFAVVRVVPMYISARSRRVATF